MAAGQDDQIRPAEDGVGASRDGNDRSPGSPIATGDAAAALDAEGRRAVEAEDYPAARAAFEQELALRRRMDDAHPASSTR